MFLFVYSFINIKENFILFFLVMLQLKLYLEYLEYKDY